MVGSVEVDEFDGVQRALLTDGYIVSGMEDQSAHVIALPRTFRVLSGCDPALLMLSFCFRRQLKMFPLELLVVASG